MKVKHHLEPMISFIGKGTTSKGNVVSTIKMDIGATDQAERIMKEHGIDKDHSFFKPFFETAINCEPIERYRTELDAINGHSKWLVEADNIEDSGNVK